MNSGSKTKPSIERFSIYWFDPSPSQGAEPRKIRPCVVVSPDEMNVALRTVLIVPLMSTIKPWPFRVTVSVMNRLSSVACDQVRAVDTSRLKARVGLLTPSESRLVLQTLQGIFAE